MVVYSRPSIRRQVQLRNDHSNDLPLVEDAFIGHERKSMGLRVVHDSSSRRLLILHVCWNGCSVLKSPLVNPRHRHARPEEIAALFAFLASDEAPYITGQPIVIDGGETAGGLASR